MQSQSTVQQTQLIAQAIIKRLKRNCTYCTSGFLDVCQAFGKVWRTGLCYKMKKIVLLSYLNLFKSYFNGREFATVNILTTNDTVIGMFADYTVIMTTDKISANATINPQHHLNQLQAWHGKSK